ncbi:hypothetical protein NGM10_09425 [Halorussus salilacus]|uniref:hypothetical protein n=1 Tax=Halorussus salilacus TaxID=2953750 RepID=UPI00209FC959|nr:hypothetical protein [Halorussus salilacus]USZ66951.1 hypothetical protein NGM10_09425 [Halorussus salilacus]
MTLTFAREEPATADDDARAVLDVSDVETDRLQEYVGEWFADVSDVYLERKGGRTFLVAGE